MAQLKSDGESRVEGTVTMWLPLEAEEGERLAVSSGRDIWPGQVFVSVGQEDGAWVVGSAIVKGRIYRKDGTVGDRWSEKMYTGPHDDGEFEGPKWLIELIDAEVPRRLGGAVQAAETGTKEAVSSWEIIRRVRADRPRERFESALQTMLTQENLNGAEWAIRRVREEAERFPDSSIAEIMKALAVQIGADLDKRTSELAAREDSAWRR